MPNSDPNIAARPFEILVVDDEEDVRESIASQLASWGHHVSTAGSAREALTSLECLKIDLAIVDVIMPRMDGLELAAMIRMAHRFVPILLLSGASPKISQTAMRELHIEGIISKPLQRAAIDATLSRMTSRMAETGKISLPAF